MGISFEKIRSRTKSGDGLRREKLEAFIAEVDAELKFMAFQFTALGMILNLPHTANDPDQAQTAYADTLAMLNEVERRGGLESIYSRAVELLGQVEAHESVPSRRRTNKGAAGKHQDLGDGLKAIRTRLEYLIGAYPEIKKTLDRYSGGKFALGKVTLVTDLWGD